MGFLDWLFGTEETKNYIMSECEKQFINQKGETVTDVYFDELFDRIDKIIEYIPEYNR